MASRRLLELADRMRIDPSAGTRAELWRIANEDSTGQSDRVALLHHAFVHAGLFARPDGVCEGCGVSLLPKAA